MIPQQGRAYLAYTENNRGERKRRLVEPFVPENVVRIKRPRTDYFPTLAEFAAAPLIAAATMIQKVFRGFLNQRFVLSARGYQAWSIRYNEKPHFYNPIDDRRSWTHFSGYRGIRSVPFYGPGY